MSAVVPLQHAALRFAPFEARYLHEVISPEERCQKEHCDPKLKGDGVFKWGFRGWLTGACQCCRSWP